MNSHSDATPHPIKPVLILSTGRCGSTMVSEMLNRHPRVLSLSEFFVPLGPEAFARKQPNGEQMWRIYSRQNPALHAMLKDGLVVDEALYPYDAPGSRFQAANMPPIIAVALPHLTHQPEALFDELEPFVRALPRMPLADHYRALFDYLAKKYNRNVWVERSGGSLMHAAKLLRLFPEARVIHVYRDGRDTAMSMQNHHNFRVLIGAILKCRRFGIDAYRSFLATRGSMLEVWGLAMLYRMLDIGKLTGSGLTLNDFGEFWSRLILTGHEVFGALPPDRLLNVKFEEVQQRPAKKLRELIRFINPALEDADWLEEAAAIPKPARSKFTTLPAAEQKALTKACAPGLKLLGYPL
jgi:hypothetical protein